MIDVEPRSYEQYTYLRKYVEKYPDRLDLVNTIVAVYNLGALEPELLEMLIANCQRVARLSGMKEDFDARPMAFGVKRRSKRKPETIYDDSEDQIVLDDEPVEADVKLIRTRYRTRKKKSLQQQIYDLLKSGEPISNVDLVDKFNLKDMHTLRCSISLIRRTFVQADESLEAIAEHRTSEVKHYQLKKRVL